MELFEEALQKWEQALSVGQKGDGGSTPTPGDSLRNPETASEELSEVGGPLLCVRRLLAGEHWGQRGSPTLGGSAAAPRGPAGHLSFWIAVFPLPRVCVHARVIFIYHVEHMPGTC